MNPLLREIKQSEQTDWKRWQWDRLGEFNGPIAVAALDNPEIKQIADLYAKGEIVTKEEALCQMVLALAKSLQRSREELLKIVNSSLFPPFVQ